MISKQILAQIINDWHDILPNDIIPRELDIDCYLQLNRAITITGPRRCGKTCYFYYLIHKLISDGVARNRILYVNFENPRLVEMELEDLTVLWEVFVEMLTSGIQEKVFLFFDEIQNIDKWELFIRNLLDKNCANIFITGSSAKMLAMDLATSLRGRTICYQLHPFSLSEFLRVKKFNYKPYLSTNEKAHFLRLYRQYFVDGGYPEIVLYPDIKKKLISELINTTIYLDLIERYHIKNAKIVKLMFNYLVKSKQFSTHKFFHFIKSLNIKTGKTSLYNYLEYFQDAFIVFALRKYSYSLKKQEQSLPKIYLADNAFIDAIIGRDDGKKLENLVFLSLIRKGFEINQDLFYYSNANECDFVIKKNDSVDSLIQVCFDISDPFTKERELKSLLKCGDEFNCKKLILITYDYKACETINELAIKFIPFYEFDLEKI
ncbi:MAG: ATPase [Candidatus Magnetoglobus multicellularis str. Araruama]|uniref:ATPase n=1 Tax=Candidatus Magnetoglobus multicellularis str. Araruama TaxID=890399 RepID=A0A1V1PI51_9BACT|nr:MAG: ATPase [Candidatus Magnetoglobus multicellularis str. Araruama]